MLSLLCLNVPSNDQGICLVYCCLPVPRVVSEMEEVMALAERCITERLAFSVRFGTQHLSTYVL